MTKPIIYLASPYSHPDPAVREARYVAVTKQMARMVAQGLIVFGPITMSHPVEVIGRMPPAPTAWWLDFDKAFMDACAECQVLKLPGWENSTGVQFEIGYFSRQRKLVTFIEPHED